MPSNLGRRDVGLVPPESVSYGVCGLPFQKGFRRGTQDACLQGAVHKQLVKTSLFFVGPKPLSAAVTGVWTRSHPAWRLARVHAFFGSGATILLFYPWKES